MHTQQELSSIIEDNLQKLNFSSEPKELYEPLNYIINIGGKRLRPLMSLTTYDLFAEQITEQIILNQEIIQPNLRLHKKRTRRFVQRILVLKQLVMRN